MKKLKAKKVVVKSPPKMNFKDNPKDSPAKERLERKKGIKT